MVFSCNSKTKNNVNKTSSDTILISEKQIEYKYEKLHKLFVVGDFDGDGKIDTLFLHHYSNLTKTEIDSFPYPNEEDWGDFINCFYDQDIISYLAFNKKGKDTLHFGDAIGLFCLINIGDNNLDGKDEIALVRAHLDYSRVNTCKIYTLCNGEWTLLKEFWIHEDAFDFFGEQSEYPVFSEIKGYLEKHNGEWFYLDYLNDGWDRMEDVGKMERLKLEKCK